MSEKQTEIIEGNWDHIEVVKNLETKTATITLNNPEKMNTLNFIARSQLSNIFDILNADSDVRVIVIRGAGEKAFSSGGNIKQFMEQHPEELSKLHQNVAAPERSPKPVIAQLQGYTFGVGLEIAMACDFRVASESTLLALPEIRLGMIPGSGGTQRISRIVGIGRAKDMIMRARRIPASEALGWGLLTTVVPQEGLEKAVSDLAREMLSFSPLALRVLKSVLNSTQGTPLESGLNIEGYAFGMLRSTGDFSEGVDSFVEKRKANFKGE